MEGEIDDNEVLDYAVFQISATQNSYEALACSKGRTERVAFGPLDQLALHLPEAKGSNNCFRLQLAESQNGSPWFTKFTLARFLHIVNVPEVWKSANAIEVEMSQLEDTRKFHLTLYAKDPGQSACGKGDLGCLKVVGLNQQIKVETASSDATKNELLRALDLRLIALKEELAASFSQAIGASCSINQISDLATFAQHFEATDLRNFLLKILALSPKDGLSVHPSTSSHDPRIKSECITGEMSEPVPPLNAVKPVTNGVSPAKIAQAERQSSSESEESSDSGEEERSCAERSRTLIRSASPRRSASPMRRIQIGRSGSRRSTPLTIKSLSYFPAREKPSIIRDADGTNSGDEEPSEQPPKKPDNAVRRMSVQDAINLFERKQKDQNVDIQKKKASGEISNVTMTKSVLRRWSAGMGDSFTHCSHENTSDSGPQSTSNELAHDGEETQESGSADMKVESLNVVESSQAADASSEVEVTSPFVDSPGQPIVPKAEEGNDRATTSAEWSRQKEAELNQMLMKMMESKPGKQRGTNGGSGGKQGLSNEQRGGFYSQYKEKRDEKLRAENAGRRAVKEAQFKVMKESLEQSKAVMASKAAGAAGKRDSPVQAQRPRRNSSPPVLPKKEVSKPTVTRKSLPKTSSLPATRNSWSGSLLKANVTPPTKASPGMISSNSTPNRRKATPSPSQVQPSPKTEKPIQQPRIKKGTPADVKPRPKGLDENKQKTGAKISRSVKTKNQLATGDDSAVLSAKPSFYNKVTKKSSVVPLESKPFLRKGTGIGPGVGPVLAKTKVMLSDDSSKNDGNLTQPEENESNAMIAEPTDKVLEDDYVQSTIDVNANFEVPLDNDVKHEITENSDQSGPELVNDFTHAVALPVPEIQQDEDIGISAAAWVEVEGQEISASCENGLPLLSISPGLAPAAALSSPRVRHSLSQMLQADNNEPEIIEWGNAEIPPALVYQKDAPKGGLKRLLKFTRKSKGEANVTGWASPSVFSEGEDDTEESKAASKRSSDALLRKASLQATGFEPPNTMPAGSFDGGNSSKRSTDYRGMNDPLSAHSGVSTISDKLRERQISASATSTKATRSFFSLSTFRSNKSSETKLR